MLSVWYGLLVKGQTFSMKDTKDQPTVQFKPTAGKLYTFMIIDTTATKPDYIHWMMVNMDGTDMLQVFPYEAPHPPSGTHRYDIYLCEQLHEIPLPVIKKRYSFSTKDFIRTYALKVVERINFFQHA